MKKNIVIIILSVLLLGSVVYTFFNKCEECSNNANEFTYGNGKIRVKKDGKINIEEVPSGLVGKYVGDDVGEEKEYFILKSDGTVTAYMSTGEGLFEFNGYFELNDLGGSDLIIELVGNFPVRALSGSSIFSDNQRFESIFSVPGAYGYTKE